MIMKGRTRSLTAKKNKSLKKMNQKKIQYENYEISKGITLKIINVRVEKAKIDIYGNFIYKIDNESHNEVGVELDFTGSSEIKSRDLSISEEFLIYKKQIEPFAQKKTNSLLQRKETTQGVHNAVSESEIDTISGKICEMEYLIGYNVNSIIKVEINFPNFEKQKMLIQIDEEFVTENLNLCENHLKNIAIEKLTLEQINNIFNQFNIKAFVDSEFSPELLKEMQILIENKMDKILEEEEKNKNEENFRHIAIHWRKLEKLIPQEKSDEKIIYNKEDISALDIIYGLKININIICSLSHLAEFPILIDRLFLEKNINEKGIYKIKLYKRGAWDEYFIDQFIPCFAQSFPIYTYSINSGWVVLIEKALAKMFGGYEKLSQIPIDKIYKTLTGMPIINLEYNSQEDKEMKELNNLFNKLEEFSSQGFIMTTYSSHNHFKKNQKNYENLFKENYSYPILAAIKAGKYKMIIIRNIWKENNFSGEFYLNSSQLPQNVLNYFEKFQEKSVLILSPKEFSQFFDRVTIIQTKNYYEKSLRCKFFRCQDTLETDLENILSYNYFEVTTQEFTQLKICLSLSENEYFAEKYISDKMDMSIGILSRDYNKQKWIVHYHQDFIFDKFVMAEVTLPPGKYFVIPRTMGFSMRKNLHSYNQYFSAFSLDGKLNTEILNQIFEEIFYLYDHDCSGDLSFNELEKIINRLNGQLDVDEYNNIVKKYCQYSENITLKGFCNLLRDIFILKNDSQIMEFLRNLGYDKNLYPYLHRFFSIHFYASKNLQIKSKFNLTENLDRIFCNILLENIATNDKLKNVDANLITYKSPDSTYFIEGVRNNSKRDMKEIYFDSSKSQNLYHSTFCHKYSKFINPSQVEFFMYLANDIVTEKDNKEHKKVVEINFNRVIKNVK